MRWLVLVGACANAPNAAPAPHPTPDSPKIVYARIELEDARWIDVTVDTWRALDRCNTLVREKLGLFSGATVARACDTAVLPPRALCGSAHESRARPVLDIAKWTVLGRDEPSVR